MRRFVAVLLLVTGTILVSIGFAVAQEEPAQPEESEQAEAPGQQQPVEERKHGDSFIEDLGELPGDLLTLPFTLFFKGISHAARIIDYNSLVLRTTDFLTSEDEKRKVRPIFQPLSGGGLVFMQNDMFKNGLQFRASAAVGKRTRRHFYAGLSDAGLFTKGVGLRLDVLHARLPDEDFFGLGNNSLRANETNYLHRESGGTVGLLLAPLGQTHLLLGASYSNVSIEPGRDLTKRSIETRFDEQLPGFAGAELGSLLLALYRDTRDETGHPSRGGEELISLLFAQQLGGDDYGYSKLTVDLRRYLNLFYKRVLAVRLRGEFTSKSGHREIPFFRLAELGGEDNLRGYRPVRFRNNDLLLAGLEYRWRVHGQASAYGFFEEGAVFSDAVDEFAFGEFKYSYGAGLRLRGRDGGLVATIEFAKSEEQSRFTFGLNTELRKF